MILQDVKLSSVTINYLLQWEYHHFYERLTWCLTTLPWPSKKPESQQWVLDTGQCYPSIDSIMSAGVSVTWKNFDSWGSSCPGQKRAGPSGSSFSMWRRQKQTLLPPYTPHPPCFFLFTSVFPSAQPCSTGWWFCRGAFSWLGTEEREWKHGSLRV